MSDRSLSDMSPCGKRRLQWTGMDRGDRNRLIGWLCVAFLVRMGYALLEQVSPYTDAWHYDQIGWHLAIGRGFVDLGQGTPDESVVAWPPGYPWFLSVIYRLVGHSYPAVWVVQALLGTITCLLIYVFSRRLFGPKPALLSLIMSSLFFPSILFTHFLMTETLYVFLLLGWALAFCEAIKRGSAAWALVTGLLGGWLILTKPLGIPLVSVVLGSFLVRKSSRALWLCAVVSLLVVLPWIVRQTITYHRFIPVSGAAENFWVGHHEHAVGENVLPDAIKKPGTMSNLEVEQIGYREGWRFIQAHPFRTLGLALRKLSIFFSLIRPGTFWPHLEGWDRGLSAVAALLMINLVFFVGGLGLLDSWKQRAVELTVLRSVAALIPVSLMPFYVESHFRQPFYAILLVFLGYGLTRLAGLQQIRVAAMVWGGALLLNALLDAALSWETIVAKWMW